MVDATASQADTCSIGDCCERAGRSVSGAGSLVLVLVESIRVVLISRIGNPTRLPKIQFLQTSKHLSIGGCRHCGY